MLYAGQPVGIILAKTRDIAVTAAKFVKIKYNSEQKPLLTVQEVLNSEETSRVYLQGQINPTKTGGRNFQFKDTNI